MNKTNMLLRNYVIKKLLLVTVTMAGSLAVVFCGVGFSEVMNSVIGGSFGESIIIKSLLLQLPMLLSLLLPLAIFIAGILVISDFIATGELVVMQSAGISIYNLNSWILSIAVAIALLVGSSSLYLEAKADKIKADLFSSMNFSDILSGLKPGSFYSIPSSLGIVHVSDDNKSMFIALPNEKHNKVVTAKKLYSSISETNSSWSFKDIKYYDFKPGSREGLMLKAKGGFVTLNEAENKNIDDKAKYMSFFELIANSTVPAVAAVLYWKLALPLSAIMLALFIIPIAHNKKQKHMKIIAGIMVYGLYLATNLAFRRYVALDALSYYLALLLSMSVWVSILCFYYLWPNKCK